ncbi:MAG TPA: type II toxin-antitoxin system VapC family toxin [Gaiellaceae bacterium]|nr:type II toxin-antitoxin system VapC family toxin [Gaiellaceae bacterium]
MADQYTKPYADSNVYISTLKGPDAEDPAKVQTSVDILLLGESGAFQIYASTFIEAEVIKAPGESAPLTPDQERVITEYLDREFIVWVELDRLIAQKARQLSRAFGMKPADAVHVATALRAGCDQFLTWDEKLHKDGLQVESLYVCEPHTSGWQTSLLAAQP